MNNDMQRRALAARDAHLALVDLQRLVEEAARTTHCVELEAVHLAVSSIRTDDLSSKLRTVWNDWRPRTSRRRWPRRAKVSRWRCLSRARSVNARIQVQRLYAYSTHFSTHSFVNVTSPTGFVRSQTFPLPLFGGAKRIQLMEVRVRRSRLKRLRNSRDL